MRGRTVDRAAGRTWPLLALLLAAAPLSARSQATLEGWDCAGGICTETVATVIRHAGTFLSGAGLSPEADAGHVAALEQQSQREFEYALSAPALVSARLAPGLGDLAPAASVVLWSSPDGETYAPLDDRTLVPAGDLVLVAVRQARSADADRNVSYAPSSWTLELTVRRQVPESEAAASQVAPAPLLISADADPAPEDAAQDAPELPVVAGSAQLQGPAEGGTPAAAPGPPPAAGDELAVELQRELARVGCYTAAIDGLWGPASRRAMEAFNRASGAALPVGQPSARALVQVSQAAAPVCAE